MENLPETYNNMEKLLSLLQLDEVQHVAATDLKLVNMLIGISVRERERLRETENQKGGGKNFKKML